MADGGGHATGAVRRRTRYEHGAAAAVLCVTFRCNVVHGRPGFAEQRELFTIAQPVLARTGEGAARCGEGASRSLQRLRGCLARGSLSRAGRRDRQLRGAGGRAPGRGHRRPLGGAAEAGPRHVAVAARPERDPDALTVGRAAWIRTAPHQTRLHWGNGVIVTLAVVASRRHRGKPRISVAAKYGRAHLASWPGLRLDMGL